LGRTRVVVERAGVRGRVRRSGGACSASRAQPVRCRRRGSAAASSSSHHESQNLATACPRCHSAWASPTAFFRTTALPRQHPPAPAVQPVRAPSRGGWRKAEATGSFKLPKFDTSAVRLRRRRPPKRPAPELRRLPAHRPAAAGSGALAIRALCVPDSVAHARAGGLAGRRRHEARAPTRCGTRPSTAASRRRWGHKPYRTRALAAAVAGSRSSVGDDARPTAVTPALFLKRRAVGCGRGRRLTASLPGWLPTERVGTIKGVECSEHILHFFFSTSTAMSHCEQNT